MNEAEDLIKSMSKDGKTPRAIASELYDRGLRTARGAAFSPDMVEGFLRHLGMENAPPPVLAPRSANPPKVASVSPYSRDAQPLGEPLPKIRMLRPWPLHTDFRPDNLAVRD